MMKWAAIVACALALAACEREERSLRTDPAAAEELEKIGLAPGGGPHGAPPAVVGPGGFRFEENAYQLSEGKRLYAWFNCNGCHAEGGGGMGPALLDGRWRYGSSMVDIVVSIRDGRPNGMPAFGDKIPAEQMWQLAGYVSALASLTASGAAPSRSDEMAARPGENRAPAATSGSSSPKRMPAPER